jgi:hypothetical protein
MSCQKRSLVLIWSLVWHTLRCCLCAAALHSRPAEPTWCAVSQEAAADLLYGCMECGLLVVEPAPVVWGDVRLASPCLPRSVCVVKRIPGKV